MLSDEMHDGLFEHRGGQSPAGEVLLATVLDEAPGDVVAEPLPVFLFWCGSASVGPRSRPKSLPASGERAARPFVVRFLGLAAPACSCAWTSSQLLEHVVVLGACHLIRLVRAYISYYHEDRCHLG